MPVEHFIAPVTITSFSWQLFSCYTVSEHWVYHVCIEQVVFCCWL